jgi:hypothetical protein
MPTACRADHSKEFEAYIAQQDARTQQLYDEVVALDPLEQYANRPPNPLRTRELLDLFQKEPFTLISFAFRGESAHSRPLCPSAERYGIFWENVPFFQSRVHHYLSDLPGSDEEVEWLALMQHHGAPTRLLDWSLSPYVATFFAIEQVPESAENPPVLWAINFSDLMRYTCREMLAERDLYGEHDYFRDFNRKLLNRRLPDRPVVAAVIPPRANERLIIQQGVFLYGDPHSVPFETCLRYALSRVPEVCRPAVHKIEIDPSCRVEILKELDRMNINSATLFPGLDGFCRYLRTYPHTGAYANKQWSSTLDVATGLPKKKLLAGDDEHGRES